LSHRITLSVSVMASEQPQLPISVVVAATRKGGIGKDGGLPWRIPADMAFFKQVTLAAAEGRRNAVVMGRKTWESIPAKFRPLPGRLNVVLSRAVSDPSSVSPYPEEVLVASSLSAAAELLAGSDVSEIFVIGGQQAYAETVTRPDCARVFLTRVGKEFEFDASIDPIDENCFNLVHVSKTHSHDGLPFDYVVYQRPEFVGSQMTSLPMQILGAGRFLHEEYQYLDVIRHCIEKGISSDDRTGVGTLACFGTMMRYDLRETFPLLTTKRVFWRGVVEELLWFIKGDTNGKHLSEKGIKIWDGNGSREFLDSRGLTHREEGDLGPVYGFQWRHFGAKYVDMHTDYTGQGVDQLAECIRKIKEDPNDRRILLSAWNPADLKDMALPPCHMFCQFFVADGHLSCLMYQRSCDVGLGVPFNIASYALLTCMMAQVCGLKPGEFIHQMGNYHVYKNHVEPLKTQLERTPRPFPVLRILKPDTTDIDGFAAADFELVGYDPHGKIAMEMAV